MRIQTQLTSYSIPKVFMYYSVIRYSCEIVLDGNPI